MIKRALMQSDCEELAKLWNRSAPFDQISSEVLTEKIWGDADFDESLCLALEDSNRLVGFGACVVRNQESGGTGYVKLLAIAPSHRGRGYGRQLLQTLEARLASLKVSAIRPSESAPNYLTPGIDVRYTQALLLFEAEGYQRIGETHNLLANLADLELDTDSLVKSLGAAEIEIRRWQEDDSRSLQELLESHWPAWKAELAQAQKHSPPAVHLALKAGKVIAFAGYDGNNIGTGWFGPMGTDPNFRGLGIGEVLLKHCLLDIREQGHPSAIIPWVGPIKFYARHSNARIDRVFYRYEKQLKQE